MERGKRSLNAGRFLPIMILAMLLGSGPAWAAEYAELHFSKGVLSFNEGRFEEALQELERAAELEPREAETHYYLGLVHSQLRGFPSAVAAFQRALELDPALKKVHYELGVAYFNLPDYPQALQEFRQAEEYEPRRAMVPFFLGYAHYLRKEYDRCLPYFKRAQELDPALKQNALFFSGMADLGRERFEEAKETFQAVVEADPQTDLALAARRYLVGIEERKRLSRRWSLRTNVGLQYDDNVNLEPIDSSPLVLPREFNKDQRDLRPAFFLTGEYKLLKGPGWGSALRYTFYQSIHSHLHGFDYESHQGLLSASRQGKVREMPYQINLDYGYTHGLLGQARYLGGHGVGATFSLVESPRYFTQLQYRFQKRDFHFEIPRPPFNRDSNNHALGLTQFIFSADRARYLRLGYVFDMDQARGSNWDYQGHRLLLGLQTPIWRSFRVHAEAEYYPQGYRHPSTVFHKKRRDKEYTYSVGLDWELRKGLALSFQYLRKNHDSNIAQNDYERDVYSLGFTVGF